jgi:hypothetical protein
MQENIYETVAEPAKSGEYGYEYEGYMISETFDPAGPSLAECVVRMFE